MVVAGQVRLNRGQGPLKIADCLSLPLMQTCFNQANAQVSIYRNLGVECLEIEKKKPINRLQRSKG